MRHQGHNVLSKKIGEAASSHREHSSPSLSLLRKDGEKRSKGSWLTLGPVIRKLFTDLEEETAYSLREAQCPSQIPFIISHVSH